MTRSEARAVLATVAQILELAESVGSIANRRALT